MKAREHQEGGNHYKDRVIQPLDIIKEYELGFLEGNVLKYLLRYKDKGGVEDLKKAQHYLDFLIEENEDECEEAPFLNGGVTTYPLSKGELSVDEILGTAFLRYNREAIPVKVDDIGWSVDHKDFGCNECPFLNGTRDMYRDCESCLDNNGDNYYIKEL